MLKRSLALLLVLGATVWLAGCGSSRDSAGRVSGDDTTLATAQALGIDNCLTCHSLNSPMVDKWYMSTAHGNNNDLPDANFFGNPVSECGVCHDALGDGSRLESAAVADATGAPVFNRPVVSCESCHGGGQFHNGQPSGIPFAKPTEDQCASCHQDKHGLTVAVDYENSAHKNSLNEHIYDDNAPTEVRARCSKCHTDEGARQYRLVAGDHDELVTAFDAKANLADASRVTCRTCHTPHEEETPLLAANEMFTGSVQYNTCTNCHQLTYPASHATNPDGWMKDAYHAPPVNPYGDYAEIISDTHYDDPATDFSTTKVIEGYVVRRDQDNSCADCHNLHSADNTINNQWARSAHGGHLLEAKEAAEAASADVFAAGANDDGAGTPGFAAAWTHYDWDDSNGTGPGGSNRQSCQMCHTATGAANYLSDPATYDPANNDFGHLSGWTANGWSPQNELLYCWGCHSDAGQGELRNPGAITRPYSVGGVPVTLPDLGNSNVCVNCHGARGNVENYALAGNPTTDMSTLNAGFGPGTKNVTEAHYLVAAATLYAADTRIGYEYAGQNYSPVPFFAHDGIGLNNDSPESGHGPCVACHMETEESHTWELVEKDGSGVITALKSTACIECHDGEHGPGLVVEDTTTAFGLQTATAAAAFLQEEAEGYHQALDILEAALDARGVVFTGSYPYFDTSAAGSWINEGVFGAAHNFNYLHHEPGGFAHNRYYVKRLLFDSIDWVGNDTLDGTIDIDTATYPEAAKWFGWDGVTPGVFTASRPLSRGDI